MQSTDSKRIVLASIGSLGDLHPCLALALELRRRGHSVTIGSTEFYREKVEAEGISFHAIRPNWNPTDQELIRQCENLRTGPEVLYRTLLLPHLKDTFDGLLSAAAGADLMIAGELVYAAPLVAEKLGLPSASMILSPSSFFSCHDASVLVTVPGLIHLRKAGWRIYRSGLNFCRVFVNHWSNPVRHLRRELGLRPDCDPVFQDKFAPELVLALFSRWFAEAQRDWPPQTIQSGFVYYDSAERSAKAAELAEFLASGDPPIIFTLGSTAVHHPGSFYQSSIEATNMLGRRAVLVGATPAPRLITNKLLALPYAPYSQIFPRAAVIVHQGGSGTTGQALRAGRPMLMVPYGWDQPDNAARVERLGIGLCVPRKTYSGKTAAAALTRLLQETGFANRAAAMGCRLRQEDGLTLACHAIESLFEKAELQDVDRRNQIALRAKV